MGIKNKPLLFFFFKIFFDVDHFFKVFIEFGTTLPLFYVLVFWPQGMWDPSSLTRDRTHTPCTGRLSLNHWATKEVPKPLLNPQKTDTQGSLFRSQPTVTTGTKGASLTDARAPRGRSEGQLPAQAHVFPDSGFRYMYGLSEQSSL